MKNINFNLIIEELKKEVEIAKDLWEIPVGAVIFDDLGNIISSSHNTRQSESDVIGHAEINAIRDAGNKIGDWRLNGFSMLVSLEPCDMCSLVINECRLDNVFYLVKQKNEKKVNFDNIVKFDCDKYNINVEYFINLLTDFFNNKR